MPLRSSAEAKAFVRRHTRLQAVPGLPTIRLHLTDDILSVWHATQLATSDDDAPLPYWSAAWAGGLALASYLRDHPTAVKGKRVLDFGSGSGLVAIAAAQAGAATVTAADIDPLALAAIDLNARANSVRLDILRRDVLHDPAPPQEIDLLLAADCWYEATFAAAVTPWLRTAHTSGIQVLIGDPGRRYAPTAGLTELARYDVRTTSELEDLGQRAARVYELTAAIDSTP